MNRDEAFEKIRKLLRRFAWLFSVQSACVFAVMFTIHFLLWGTLSALCSSVVFFAWLIGYELLNPSKP